MSDEKKVIGRPFRPGQSGNPSGRPKRRLTDSLLQEALEANDSEQAKAIAHVVISKAKRGNMRAIEFIAERTEGKPRQAVELSGEEGEPMRFSTLSDAELDARLAELVSKWQANRGPG